MSASCLWPLIGSSHHIMHFQTTTITMSSPYKVIKRAIILQVSNVAEQKQERV